MIEKKQIISLSTSEKSCTVAYEVSNVGFFDFLFGSEKKYFVINIFSPEKLPPSPTLLNEVLELVEQKEKYQDDRLKHGYKFSVLPLAKFPKLAFRIKQIDKSEFEKIISNN